MSYEPMPGTIAYRAIAWLKRQPAGTEVTASMWAEAIGNCDGESLMMCMKPALHAGIVKRFTKHGQQRPFWLTLGDGKPPVAQVPEDEDDRDPLPPRTQAPDVKPRAGQVLPGIEVPQFVQAAREELEEMVQHRNADDIAEAATHLVAAETKADQVASFVEDSQDSSQAAVPFDAWLSAVSGELVLTGVAVNEDGDPVLTHEQVQVVKRLLAGAAS